MLDFHHHCLPGVDDGPRTLDEAVAQCRMAWDEGLRTVVATPHRCHPQFDVPPAAARAAHATLAAALATAGIPLRVVLGSEIHYHEGLAERLDAGELLTPGDNGRWFLLELPASHVPGGLEALERVLYALRSRRERPRYAVIAHPERNDELAEAPHGWFGRREEEKVARLRGQGILMQITAGSLVGAFGRRAEVASERWLRAGLVDFVATDAHDTVRRPPLLAEARRRIVRLVGEEVAARLTGGNVERALAGGAID